MKSASKRHFIGQSVTVSAVEIGYTVLGASLYTLAAAGAELRCDIGVEVGHLHSACLTGLFTLFAADTTHAAQLAGNAALVAVGAAVKRHLLLGYDRDDPPRASLDAERARAALVRVDIGDAVANADSVVFAYSLTVAQTHTAV